MTHIDPDFKALFEASPGMLLAVDPAFNVVAVNDGYLRTISATREEAFGRSIFDVLSSFGRSGGPVYRELLLRSLVRVRDTRVADSMVMERLDLPDTDGEAGAWVERYWSSRNSPVLDDHHHLRYIIRRIEDVTEVTRLREAGEEQQLVAAELEQRTVEMAAEIMARSDELETANALLHAASDAKNEFLSRMSHELRTPLAAILGFSELLGMQDLDATSRRRVETIEKAGEHLLKLVDEVLDISRIEAGELAIKMETVAVAPVIEESLELMQGYADRSGIRLNEAVVAGDCHHLLADPGRLRQVLINLISNAIKYNSEAGEVSVTVANAPGGSIDTPAAASRGRRARISVNDRGAGLDAASLQKLFVPFERLAASATNVEGTGLGLALSRSLVEGMGGALDVESTVGEGSTFWIELDAVEPGPVEPSAAAGGLELTSAAGVDPTC